MVFSVKQNLLSEIAHYFSYFFILVDTKLFRYIVKPFVYINKLLS